MFSRRHHVLLDFEETMVAREQNGSIFQPEHRVHLIRDRIPRSVCAPYAFRIDEKTRSIGGFCRRHIFVFDNFNSATVLFRRLFYVKKLCNKENLSFEFLVHSRYDIEYC